MWRGLGGAGPSRSATLASGLWIGKRGSAWSKIATWLAVAWACAKYARAALVSRWPWRAHARLGGYRKTVVPQFGPRNGGHAGNRLRGSAIETAWCSPVDARPWQNAGHVGGKLEGRAGRRNLQILLRPWSGRSRNTKFGAERKSKFTRDRGV